MTASISSANTLVKQTIEGCRTDAYCHHAGDICALVSLECMGVFWDCALDSGTVLQS